MNANDAVPKFLSNPVASSASSSGTCFSDSEVSTFEFSADASFNSSDSEVNIYDIDGTCLFLDNSSLEWYNNNQSSISSPLSASPFEEIGNPGVQGARGTECGDACLQVSQTALLQQYSSCSFSSFGSRPATTNAPPFSRQKSSSSSASTSALSSVPKLIGSVHTTAPHNPASGKRHFFLEVRNPILKFHMPSACAKTKGVAVIDILTFEGQCIVDPGASVASELTNGDLQKASIDLVIEVCYYLPQYSCQILRNTAYSGKGMHGRSLRFLFGAAVVTKLGRARSLWKSRAPIAGILRCVLFTSASRDRYSAHISRLKDVTKRTENRPTSSQASKIFV